MSDKDVIGFIGVGYMGHGMAHNIMKGGYPLVIKGNKNRVPVDDLVNSGASEAQDLADLVAQCDVIHMCLSNSPQVENIIFGAGGILENAKDELIVIDCTTADPTSTSRIAAAMAEKGMHFVDAPLGRTPKEAAEGTLDAMIGASDDLFERIKPIVECWSGNIIHVGPVGAGHKMKLIMNFIAMSYASLYSEATVLAAKSGLSPQKVNEVIGSSRLSNGFFDTFMKYLVGGDPNAHKFSLENGAKDIGYVANMAHDAQMMNPMGAAAKNYFTHAIATGNGGNYVPTLVDLIGAMNGINIQDEVEKGR